jgi:hypothetical protein
MTHEFREPIRIMFIFRQNPITIVGRVKKNSWKTR